MSESYFSRTFRMLVNKSVFEYLHYYRVNCAVELLKNSTLPVAIISQKVGYESCSYFIKRFKQLTGKTPYGFRKDSNKFS